MFPNVKTFHIYSEKDNDWNIVVVQLLYSQVQLEISMLPVNRIPNCVANQSYGFIGVKKKGYPYGFK